MSEQVYRLGRGPRHHYRVGFGVSQAARTLRFQENDLVSSFIYRITMKSYLIIKLQLCFLSAVLVLSGLLSLLTFLCL